LYAESILPAWLYGPSGVGASGQKKLILTGVFAFVAGFSERFIPDLILRKAQQSGEDDLEQSDAGASLQRGAGGQTRR
jgi:hypothetical protein